MKLLEPLKLNDLISLKNRIVMAPMTRSRVDNNERTVSDLHAEYYRQRAGAGLIINEGTVVSEMAVGYLRVPGIYTAEQTEAWKKVTEAVHKESGLIFCQLWHVGRITHPVLIGGRTALSASALNHKGRVLTPEAVLDALSPREMDKNDIETVKNEFVLAAKNALEAGFDGVEIHSSNGYLFHQFFSSSSNIRTDEYGGSVENRARFFFEVLDAMLQVIPAQRIAVRLNPMMHDSIGILVDEYTLPVFDYIVQRLNDYPIAFLHLTRPTKILDLPYFEKDIIGRYRKIYQGILLVNGAYSPEEAELEISSGRADAVAFGKLFISNPNLPEKIKNGEALKEWDQASFYSPGEKGYTDY
jgi:N-ethylmaleimide reductase